MSTALIFTAPRKRRRPLALCLGVSALLVMEPDLRAKEAPPPEPIELEETLVKQTHMEGEWTYREPRSVSTITRQQIDQRPPRHAADMLEDSTGIYTAVHQRDAGLSVNIRGVQDYGRVNMNIDGARQNFNISGHQQRNGTLLIDPEVLAGIDLEKGSQSGQGGAAVLGGIATFRTLETSDFLRGNKQFGGRLRAGHGIGKMGNGTHFNGSQLFALGNEVGDVLVGISERHFGDYWAGKNNMDHFGPQIMFKDQYPSIFRSWMNSQVQDASSVTRSRIAKVGINLPHDQRLKLTYLQTDADSKDSWVGTQGNRIHYERAGANEFTAVNWALDYSYKPASELIDFTAKTYFVRNQRDRWNQASSASLGSGNWFPAYTDRHRTDTWGLQAQNTAWLDLDAHGQLKWAQGAELFQDRFTPETTMVRAQNTRVYPYVEGATPAGIRTMASVFSSLDYRYDDWLTLSAGLRYDQYRLQGQTGMTVYKFSVARQRNLPEAKLYSIDQQLGQLSPTVAVGIKPGVEGVEVFGRWGKGGGHRQCRKCWPLGDPMLGAVEKPSTPIPLLNLNAPETGKWVSTTSRSPCCFPTISWLPKSLISIRASTTTFS